MFKDHFSTASTAYQRYRPGYPAALFEHLVQMVPERQCAWDCATGSGQSAIALAAFFETVIATDASEAQIAKATPQHNVKYMVSSAERSGLSANSLDLITVAQALHWFDLKAFSDEAERVLKPGGVLAVWTYNLLQVNAEIDALVKELYRALSAYWPPERAMVEQGYSQISFPFPEITVPTFSMSAEWELEQLTGYLQTWSALKRYQSEQGDKLFQSYAHKLADAWGDPKYCRAVSWPLSLRVWRRPV